MGKPSWKFHSKILTGFRNTKLWSGNLFFSAIFLMKLGFLTIFDFKALYFWNQSTFLNETFRRASPLRFPKNEAILDGHGNCLMPAMPIFQKHWFFKKCPKNLTNFGKFQTFFLHFLLQFYRAFLWYIICFYTLSGLSSIDQNVNQEIGGYASFFQRLYHVLYCISVISKTVK